MVEFTVVIPARHASTRLPGKMLADINGKPMVVRVAERARESGAADVIVATDHPDIAAAAEHHGHASMMTRIEHASGTDRIAEVAARCGYLPTKIIVNVQGDEPLIAPELIRRVARQLADHPDVSMATACCPLDDVTAFINPNVVKVVLDRNCNALYFSRATIPYARDAFATSSGATPASRARAIQDMPAHLPAYRHIGIYAYRAGFLADYQRLEPAPIEQFEALEQLRALWHGHRISVAITDVAPHAGVDTPEDLERVRRLCPGG